MISIDDFNKLDLRVGKIENAEVINGSNLLKLTVNLGKTKKTIVAGIGNRYDIEELLGQLIVVVNNLEPKVIKGVKSEAMLLAVDSEQGPVLIVPLEQVIPGSKVI